MNEKNITDKDLKLSTYAKRIRHIKGLCIKNISYKCTDIHHLEVYFSLHPNATSTHFYKSESVRGTINAGWRSIDIRHVPWYYAAPSQLCLRVWVKDGDSLPKVHLEYDLDLQMLVLSSSNPTTGLAESGGETTPSDLLTIEMFGATFELPSSDVPRDEFLYLSTDQTPKVSYSTNQLSRLQTVLRALRQTEQLMSRVKEDINGQIAEKKSITGMQEQAEASKVRVSSIRSKLEQKRRILQAKRSRLANRRAETSKHEKEIDYSQKLMQEDDGHFADVKSDYYNARERLLKGNALLSQRQKQLVHELSLIYPIEQMNDGRYTIAGVYMPNAEQVTSQNEMASSTSLGYTAHLVSMLSQFLELPLEYPIRFRGSRSLIYDMARPAPLLPSQKDRSLPLYSRGKDKKLFVYASQLLNKNIENLRHAYELPTKDPKLTLKNLKDFLHSKFDVGLVSQPQQESRSPPMALQRATSVTHIRHPTLAALGRSQTMTTDWSSAASGYLNEEYSSDETHSKPSEVLAHSFYRNSSPLSLPHEHQPRDSSLPTNPLLKKSMSFDSIKHNRTSSHSDSSQQDTHLSGEIVKEVSNNSQLPLADNSCEQVTDGTSDKTVGGNTQQGSSEKRLHMEGEGRKGTAGDSGQCIESQASQRISNEFIPNGNNQSADDTSQQVDSNNCPEITGVDDANGVSEERMLTFHEKQQTGCDTPNHECARSSLIGNKSVQQVPEVCQLFPAVNASHSSSDQSLHNLPHDNGHICDTPTAIPNDNSHIGDTPAGGPNDNSHIGDTPTATPNDISRIGDTPTAVPLGASYLDDTSTAVPWQIAADEMTIEPNFSGPSLADTAQSTLKETVNATAKESEEISCQSGVESIANAAMVEEISEPAETAGKQLADSLSTLSEANESRLNGTVIL